MSDPSDSTDWESGQPAPWLDQYGPPPVDQSIAGSPGADSFGPVLKPPGPDQPQAPIFEQPAGPTSSPDLGAAAPEPGVPPWIPPQAAGPFAPPPEPPPPGPSPQAPVNPNQPDAITGGQLPGGPTETPEQTMGRLQTGRIAAASQMATDPNASLSDREAAWKALPPEQRAVIIATGNSKELAPLADIMDPGDLTAATIRHNDLSQQHYNDQRIALELQRQQQAQQDFQVLQAAQTKAAADTAADRAEAKRISMIPIDPNKGHGVGRFIADVITAGIGGAMSQYTGGKNLALEAHQRRTEQSIQIQKDNIANQLAGVTKDQNFVADQLQRSGDMYRSTQIYRIAQNDRADGELAATAQNYDQQGTTAYKIANARMAIAGATQQATQALHQQNFKNSIDAANAGLQIHKETAEEGFKKQDLALKAWETSIKANEARANIAKTQSEIGDQTPIDAATFHARYPTAEVPPELAAGAVYTPKQLTSYLSTGKAIAEASKTSAEAAKAQAANQVSAPIKVSTDEDGNTVVKTGVLKKADGSIWVPPEKFTSMLGGAASVNRLSDQLTREIAEWGGQSDIKKGDHWQQIKGDYNDLVFALHATKGIEGFRPGTAELLHELIGDVDPTSFLRDARSGIQRAKQNVNADINDVATAAGYDNPAPIEFADTSHLPPPKVTAIDSMHSSLEEKIGAKPDNSLSTDDKSFLNFVQHPATPRDQLTPEVNRAIDLGIPPSHLATVDNLLSAMQGSDATEATKARAALNDLVKSGLSSNLEDYIGTKIGDAALSEFKGSD